MEGRRTCCRCFRVKSETEFAYRNRAKGIRHTYCLECGRAYARNHYSRHIPYYVRKAGTRRNLLLNDFYERLFEYLSTHPCVDCGETDPIVLEFDHVRGEKSYNVTTMARRMFSWDRVMREIAKCEVRCANCHRRKTAERCGSFRYKKYKGPLAQFG